MSIGEFLERFGRAVFEAPLGSGGPKSAEPAELAEIRLAVLNRIQGKSYRSGGRKVFPYDLLTIRMRGVEESQREVFAGRFFRQYMEQEVRAALRHAGCRYPADLRVHVDAEAGLPQRGQEWLTVEVATQDPTALPAPGILVVRQGSANVPVLRLDKARINIGRVVDVYREEGLFRRNDLAFPEEGEINRSVSREHAHIVYDRAAGEYRLFNDRWQARGGAGECGTWIVRDGMSHEVHRTARGVRLEPGDEIHFGRAVVTFESGEKLT
jgi:hypothetical protein